MDEHAQSFLCDCFYMVTRMELFFDIIHIKVIGALYETVRVPKEMRRYLY